MVPPGAVSFDRNRWAAEGESYLLAFVKRMPRPLPWGVIRQWAGRGSLEALFADATEYQFALGQRDQNIARYWTRLAQFGFSFTDATNTKIASKLEAFESEEVHLSDDRNAPCFDLSARIGFFTHSLMGNAIGLLLSTNMERQACWSSDVAHQPNRHYLANGEPVDFGRFVLVRHLTTEANQAGIALGRSEGSEGWRGEVVARQHIGDCPVGVATWYCSTLSRTRATARAFGVTDVIAHTEFDEMDIGVAEGVPEHQVMATLESAKLMFQKGDPFAAIVDEWDRQRGCGECFAELLVRAARRIEQLRDSAPNMDSTVTPESART